MTRFTFFRGTNLSELNEDRCRSLFIRLLKTEEYTSTIYPKEYQYYGYKIRVNYLRVIVDNITGETGYICNATLVPTIMGEMHFYIETIMQYEL